jgi:hypothetical protein
VGANQGAADEMAQTRENEDALLDQQGAQAAAKGDRLSYGQYLAKRRMRELDSTPTGGNVTDNLLANRGKAQSQGRTGFNWNAAQNQRDNVAGVEGDYWARQAERNKGIASADKTAREEQDSRFGKAWTAWDKKNTADMHDNAREISFADEDAAAPARRGSPLVETGYESDEAVQQRQARARAVGDYYRGRQQSAMRNQANFKRPGGR